MTGFAELAGELKKLPIEDECCQHCIYYLRSAMTNLRGTCRRLPPQPAPVLGTGWPFVCSHDWCGEWDNGSD